jgi:transcriptional regulator with GAF, ATPase, and Fis domain
VVRVEGAPARPDRFVLREGVCVIGSAPACDMVIDEPTVSRMHAELQLLPEGVGVRDLGSRNGIFWLGQRVEKIVLGLGGRLEIGAATVRVDPDAGTLGATLEHEGGTYRGAVGASPAMRRIFGMLLRLEGSLVTVLLEGESGAGKEVIARALHEGSPCAGGPMVTVNCGAIPRELVQSELFGHKKGAFTGAAESRSGAFEAADGGTLFLDEIGELPLDVQPVLLRALESGEVQPVGGDRTHQVKVRIVAATNRDLEAQVAAGAFREDLFYRLAVVRLRVPPLRERLEDIEPMANHFARGLGMDALPPEVVDELRGRRWPGNARELRNAVHVYAALGALPEPSRARGGLLDTALRELVDPSRPYSELKDELTDRFTRLYLTSLLERAKGNQSAAARMAGLDRTYLGRLLAKHGFGREGGGG